MGHSRLRAITCVFRLARLAALTITLFLSAGFRPASAGLDLFTVGGQPVTVSATLRSREEVWNFFGPGEVSNGQDDNRYNFLGGFLRMGVGYQHSGVGLFTEMMAPYLVNLPDNSIAPAPQGLLGLGANYYQPNQVSNTADAFLKQGFLVFGRDLLHGLELKGGRFEFFDGQELMPDEPQLRWLVDNRIAQRLVANFGFSDVERSFDGAEASYRSGPWQFTAMYGVPTKGVFYVQGMDEIRDMDLAYASLNVGPNPHWGNSLGRIFYIYYHDGRGLAPVDNRPTNVSNADRRGIEIHSVLADYAGVFALGPGAIDLLVWGGGQLGAWGRLKQESWAAVGEAGYRFNSAPWQPWLRAGYTVTSGDSNPNDSTHQTFFQILPTPRIYAMFPFYNMMNLNDLMGQVILAPAPGVELSPSIHGLWLSASRDLWYAGGGAFNNSLFGYTGRPADSRNNIATLLDCQLKWIVNDHLAATFYYGHAFGGGVVSANFPGGKEADFGFVEMVFSL